MVYREVDWLFSSDPGRLQLAESAGFERLVVVAMHRGHTYSNLEAVKEEVSAKAVELVQHGLPQGKKVYTVRIIIIDTPCLLIISRKPFDLH